MTIQAGIAPSLNDFNSGTSALGLAFSDAQTLLVSSDTQIAYMAFSETELQSVQSRFDIFPASSAEGVGPWAITIPLPLKAQSGVLYFVSGSSTASTKVSLLSIRCGNSSTY